MSGMQVGSIYATFDGDSSRLVAAQEKMRAAIGGTTKTLEIIRSKLGDVSKYADRTEASVVQAGRGVARASDGFGKASAAAERAATKLEQLRGTADRVDDKMGKLQTAVGGLSSAFGIAGTRIGDAIGGIADSAMVFASGGPIMAAVLVIGTIAAAAAANFTAIDTAASDATAAATEYVANLRQEVSDLNDELLRLRVGGDRATLELQGRKVVAAAEAAAPGLDALGGRDRFNRLLRDELNGVDIGPILRAGGLSDDIWIALKTAVSTADLELSKLANLKRIQDEQEAQRRSDDAVDQANLQEQRFQERKNAQKPMLDAERVDAWLQRALHLQNGGILSSTAFDQTSSIAPFRPDVSLMDDGASTRATAVQMGVVAALTADEAAELTELISTQADLKQAVNERIGAEEDAAWAAHEAGERVATAGLTRDDLVSIAAGTLSAGSVGGIASAFGAGPIGMLFDAIVGAIREGMSLVIGEVSELVGDQRFASASESSVDPLMSGLTTAASMGTASPGLAVVAGPIAVAGAAAEFAWSLSMATKSSERFQGGMSVVVDRMVAALEPLWAGMLPLVGVFDMMATAAMPLLSAFAAQVPAAVESFFPAIQLMVVGFATITWITGVVGNGLIDFAQVISFFNDDAQATLERMKFNTEALWAAREDAQAMTWESAGAAGEASAALWELADAAEGASANLPTGYRVPLYDAERPDGRGSGTIINLYGGITLQPTTPDLARALREGVMAARGRNVWQSGGEDDDTN